MISYFASTTPRYGWTGIYAASNATTALEDLFNDFRNRCINQLFYGSENILSSPNKPDKKIVGHKTLSAGTALTSTMNGAKINNKIAALQQWHKHI